MMRILRSVLFYIAFYGGSTVLVMLAATSIKRPSRMRYFCDKWSLWHRWCVENLLRITVRVENRPAPGPALFVIKHESFFEAIDMPILFDFPAPFAKQELFDIPGWGTAARSYGIIPVARDGGASTLRVMLKEARQRSAEGRPLVLFPEGTRVPHGQQAPLKSGFAAFYKMLGLPIIPVAVNSGPLYQRRWKTSGTITYRFGEPVPSGLPREEAEARVIEAINALNS